jgi:hypothetical protein
MKSTRMRLVGAAAALSAVAIAVPVSPASAATAAPALGPFPTAGAGWGGAGWGGAGWGADGAFPFVPRPFPGAAVVVGPVIITTAPSSFINTNNQVTAGDALSGGQVTAP